MIQAGVCVWVCVWGGYVGVGVWVLMDVIVALAS